MLQRYRQSQWLKAYQSLSRPFSTILESPHTAPDYCFAYFSSSATKKPLSSTTEQPLLLWAKWKHVFALQSWQIFLAVLPTKTAVFTEVESGLTSTYAFLLQEKGLRQISFFLALPVRFLSSIQEHASRLGLAYTFLALSEQEGMALCALTLDKLTYRGLQWGLLLSPIGLIGVFGNEQAVHEISFVTETLLADSLHWLTQRHRYLKEQGSVADLSFNQADLADILPTLPLPQAVTLALHDLSLYFSGHKTPLRFPISFMKGTEFQQKIWQRLQEIPWGATITYLELAQNYLLQEYKNEGREVKTIDLKKARQLTRAVGAACKANPLPIRLPCHRVVGQEGKLIGYHGGIHLKEALLNLELWGY